MTDLLNMIEENLKNVLDRIQAACRQSSRDPSAISIVAVSKRQELQKMLDYIDCMHAKCLPVIFGENYVQEFKQKRPNLLEYSYESHFIGTLQSNKVKLALELFDVIESVHSEKLCAEIDRQAGRMGKPANIFFEINVSADPAKSGFLVDDFKDFVNSTLAKFENLRLHGLMTITKDYDHVEDVRQDFAKMRELRDWFESFVKNSGDLAKKMIACQLSMGMSSDFDIAIQEGADLVRIGSALFGERVYD